MREKNKRVIEEFEWSVGIDICSWSIYVIVAIFGN